MPPSARIQQSDSPSAVRDRVKDARRDLYRGLIIEAAEELFARDGLAGVSVAQIAGEAGVSRKTLYDCFSGKQDIFDALETFRANELFAATRRGDGTDQQSALEVLRGGIRTGVRFLIEHPAFLRLHLREGNAWAVRSGTGATPDLGPWRHGLAMSARVIERGIREGVFVDERPDLLSKMMSAVYQVQLADWLARANGEPADSDDLIARIESNVLRLLCRPRDERNDALGERVPAEGPRPDSSRSRE